MAIIGSHRVTIASDVTHKATPERSRNGFMDSIDANMANDEVSGDINRPPDRRTHSRASDVDEVSPAEYARKRVVVEKMPLRLTNIRDELEYVKQKYHHLKKTIIAEREQVRLDCVDVGK
jgi:hypothetical protein